MRKLASIALTLFTPFLSHATEFSGRANAWLLYLADDFDTQSVVDIYDGTDCANPGNLDFTVVGKDRSLLTACDSVCCIERVIRDGETIIERVVENSDGSDSLQTLSSTKSGNTLIGNVGIDAKAKKGKLLFKTKGNLTSNILESRATYGSRKYRFRFTDAYLQYKEPHYQASFGRKAVSAGALIDGLDADYFMGKGKKAEDFSIGAFAGLAPDPISKHLDKDRITFGAKTHFIPEFSSKKASKLRMDASVVGEYWKGGLNRAYLFTSSHFSPTHKWAFFHYSTVELPAPGDDSQIDSSQFSLQSTYRPNREWYLSFGFSQFRLERFLKEESVRWLTDNGSFQSARLGDTLDRSHRFRFDFRASYKPFYYLQPYVKARYERRGIDSNKRLLNQNPTSTDPADEDLTLINRKNAYTLSFGVRSFPLNQLETDSVFSFNRRYQSRNYDLYQSATWTGGNRWSADAYVQIIWSNRDIQNSVSSVAALDIDATDYYLGLGGSYKILSDLFGQVRYDFALEDDYSLGGSIAIHSVLARLDYRF